MKLISQAAEAKIYLYLENNNKKNKNNTIKKIIKKRINKVYRIPDIDIKLRKQRTKREVKILNILKGISPKVISTDNIETIEMEYLKGELLKNILDRNPKLALLAGKQAAIMHEKGIIHGDLTTSNMILNKGKLFIIDFGLSSFSKKIEDQAVDIHLFKQALMSKHHKVSEKAFEFFLKGYSHYKNHKNVLQRFKEVEKRGRYKGKNY
ncbi:MAG: KEOPS complex kinase/ATPase Bud32 [Candidatus Woesearchaeota archaeon]